MLKHLLFFLLLSTPLMSQNFIQINGKHFEKAREPYYFLGTNFWYGINLASNGPGGDRERLLRELDRFKALGINNLRIMAGSEGPDSEPWRMKPSLQSQPDIYNEKLLDGLDFLLSEMTKRDLHAVVCLNNFWAWSGGMAQYVNWVSGKPIPYHHPVDGGWTKYSLYTSRFYKLKKAKALYWAHIETLINRKNTYTGKLYKDDPTIMAWQLANEPRGMFRPRKYRRWIRETAALIKSLDTNHLVSIGSEGNTPYPIGNHFYKDHKDKNIDYLTFHIWIQNWQWYDPENPEASFPKAFKKAADYLEKHLAIAERLDKPIVMEEFGIARDHNDHSDSASTEWRDHYFKMMFQLVYEKAKTGTAMAGCNFWAWGGEGRPSTPKAIWEPGDDFIGDPPHEFQGWYSVYENDLKTLKIIQEFTGLFEDLRFKN
ncbi:MAG: mannan endo-1,4-beta-mannosidase [Saprospiraceae bacterium]|jgi:mannan endo-1,4-beta-mannosidase